MPAGASCLDFCHRRRLPNAAGFDHSLRNDPPIRFKRWMSRTYVIVPLVLTTALAVYDCGWCEARPSGPVLSAGILDLGNAPDAKVADGAMPPVLGQACSGDEYEYRDGAAEAVADLLEGRVVLLTAGLPSSIDDDYSAVWRRYGVRCRAIAGCVVWDSLLTYAADYNRVMRDYIVAVHGADIFARVRAEAEARFQERSATAMPPR